MRVAVKANLTPACGGFKPPPKGLSPTNRPRSLDLVPPRQRASVARRSARVGHAPGRPKPPIGLRRRAGATPIRGQGTLAPAGRGPVHLEKTFRNSSYACARGVAHLGIPYRIAIGECPE